MYIKYLTRFLILFAGGFWAVTGACYAQAFPGGGGVSRGVAMAENLHANRSINATYLKAVHAAARAVDSSIYNLDLCRDSWQVLYFPAVEVACDAVERRAERGSGGDPARWGAQVRLPGAWQVSPFTRAGGRGDQVASVGEVRGVAVWSEGGYYRDSTVAVYTREFSAPFNYMDKTMYLRIGGVQSAVRLYVNGQYVGASNDSRLDSEFNITSFVTRGVNRVELVVCGWDTTSLIEDQTGWRLNGVNRGVTLMVQPKVRIFDFLNTVTLDPGYKHGLLQASVLMKTELLNPHTVTVFYDLYNPSGELVNREFKDVRVGMREVDTVRFLSSLPDAKLWNAETPNLYTMIVGVKREGRFTEHAAVRVGVRVVEVQGNRLMVNGVPVMIKGVNVEEFDSNRGDVMTEGEVRKMMGVMKLSGINAIQGAGYPLPEFVYDLADELGFYVSEVANINVQGGDLSPRGALVNNLAWEDVMVDRVRRTCLRVRNHPSVIMWSLGSQAGNGYNMYQAYRMLKALDPSRPVQYSGAGRQWNSDILCPRQVVGAKALPASFDGELKLDLADGRPVIPSSVAGVDLVPGNRVFWSSPRFQGAFLDRWFGPSLDCEGSFARLTVVNGRQVLAPLVGGKLDISGFSSDTLYNNCEIRVVDLKTATFSIANKLQFTNLKDVPVRFEVLRGGKVLRSGPLQLAVGPGCSVEFQLPKVRALDKAGHGVAIYVGDLYYFFNQN